VRALRYTVASIAAALLLALPAQALAGPDRARLEARLERGLDKLVDTKGGPPGVSALLRRGDKEAFLTSGVADVDTGARFGPNKHMRIASVSKAFSGAVALSLVDRGLLSLDDTIAARLPSLPAAWGPVTLRQALSRSGGIPSYTTEPEFLQFFAEHIRDSSITKQQLVDFVRDEPLEFAPGTSYHYSNTDNIIIAMMAESATGKSYEQLLAELVADPLELRRTELPKGFEVPAPLIRGYETLPEIEDLTECCAMAFVSASGGIYSTPRQLTRFTRGYVGGELFAGPTRAAQFEFVPGGASEPPGPGKNSAGLALFRYQTKCGTVFGHTGNFPGYAQFTAATRSGKRVVTVTVNRQLAPDAPGKFAPEAFEVLRKDYRLAVCALLG
jgi:D-alanyl-D-alanine carboxypeptidase